MTLVPTFPGELDFDIFPCACGFELTYRIDVKTKLLRQHVRQQPWYNPAFIHFFLDPCSQGWRVSQLCGQQKLDGLLQGSVGIFLNTCCMPWSGVVVCSLAWIIAGEVLFHLAVRKGPSQLPPPREPPHLQL